MTLQELLDDAQVSDELEVTLGDKGKFKVSDLRAADKSRKAKALADDAAVKAALANANKKQEELTTLATEAAALIEKMKGQPQPVVPKEGDIDFDTDPLYSPLVKALLKPMQAKQAEFDNAIKQVNSAVTQSAQFILNDYYDRRWDRIPADKRKDKTWKDYLKIANEKKVLNEFGLPDPVKALMEEVQPMETDALTKERDALKLKVEELEKAAKAPRMPRAGTSGAPPSGQKDKGKVFESVDALVDEAFNDPMIQEIAGRA